MSSALISVCFISLKAIIDIILVEVEALLLVAKVDVFFFQSEDNYLENT